MKNQYQKLTPPPRPSNPTPLELAIHRYEQDCAKFHNKRNSTLPEDSTKTSNIRKLQDKIGNI
ncbi:hypothetical protein [Vibrio penaeicida]|uniref:hypothetical protein n=1 Tax=Vibrio penaeicida TaxID=104609 RepID=UPI001CC67184|nr:hypothetical protein [Vibrio penaeicida]